MVIVDIEEGKLEGEILESVFGDYYYSFKGIPYAAPPIGELRFMPPQPAIPWVGTLKANIHGPVSMQYDPFKRKFIGSEDCLYLNVYSPKIAPKTLLPVMVWVHEGSFSFGSGNTDFHGPDFLIDHGIVLVTFNYRLKILGFLSLQNDLIPGNAAMKDQVAAFKWVKRNISKFGGDPENITAFGGSSGSISISYHLLSPMSKGLFKRAILQSGLTDNLWAISIIPRERALALAKYLGFRGNEDKELYEFFKTVDAKSLTTAPDCLTLAEAYTTVILIPLMHIIADEKTKNEETFFCLDYLENDIHEGVEIIVGYNAHEGASVISLKKLGVVLDLYSKHIDSFAPKEVIDKCTIEEQIEVSEKLKKFYFGDEEVTISNINKLIKYVGMHSFIFHVIQWAKRNVKKNVNSIYLYNFRCISERNYYAKLWGGKSEIGENFAFHCDEISYLFDNEIVNFSYDEHSSCYKMIRNITTLWTNFAKYGDPTPDDTLGVKWRPYTLPDQNYLRIEQSLRPGTKPKYEEIAFWENIYQEYIHKVKTSKL